MDAFTDYLELTDRALDEIGTAWDQHEPFDFSDSQLDERANGYRRSFETFVDRSKETLDA